VARDEHFCANAADSRLVLKSGVWQRGRADAHFCVNAQIM
jgi:hypothetical protein